MFLIYHSLYWECLPGDSHCFSFSHIHSIP
jgi:hypothetical protein